MKPTHIALIMDGNRRWASKRGLRPNVGHQAGVEALEKIVKEAILQGIKYLTVYALSTENLKNRQAFELRSLFSILQKGFTSKLPSLRKEGVKVNFFGDLEGLPFTVKKALAETEKQLKQGERLVLNIALNYGSRAEIIKAAGEAQKSKLTEKTFADHLYTAGVPDPDLIIRTGGEKRLSNFLLWQAAYSELYFSGTLWPDFNEKELKKALKDYENRKRNFGK
jgi:undecaprenyl diphosphate synthase